jgi:hypothetical protein
MSNVATVGTAGWDGTGAVYAWTITSNGGDTKQTTAANHGTGNICGLEFGKGSASAATTMASTTNAINAAGTAGTVQFWAATSNLTSGLGWNFQLATDAAGTNWTTRLNESTGTNHAHQAYTYTLLPTERVSTLRMRFQFIGNGTGGPTGPKTYIDDITVVTTTGSPPSAVAMLDDGLHGDGVAGDGIYGGLIPVQSAGTTISYTIGATDSNGSTAAASYTGSYTVSAITPAANFLATASMAGNSVIVQWPSQSGISYSVQWSEDLLHWTNVPVGQTNTWTDSAATSGVGRKFYRVMR